MISHCYPPINYPQVEVIILTSTYVRSSGSMKQTYNAETTEKRKKMITAMSNIRTQIAAKFGRRLISRVSYDERT
jgi:hypothetical protein